MSSFKTSGALLVLSLVTEAAFAQGGLGTSSMGAGKDWALILSASKDEESFENLFASFNLGLLDETWLSITAGRSRAPSTEQEVKASLVELGIDHNFGPVGLGLSAERWGDANNLESSDWRGEIFFGGDRYRFALVREVRDIDIFFSGAGAPIATDLRRVGIDADGLGLSWRYRFNPNWQTYGSWMDYDYPRGVRLLPRIDRLNLLSASAVTLAYSFVEQYQTIGIERSLGLKLINFDYSQDRSTIDGERLKSFGASILWPVAPRMDLEFRVGSSRAGGFGSTAYGGLTLLIYGGG